MLIFASLSGIQDFLFDVRESGGKQARSLRFRSFRIQLMTECVAQRLLQAAGLRQERLLFCAAARVCIDATGLDDAARPILEQAAAELEHRVLRETHGRLRLTTIIRNSATDFQAEYAQANRAVAARKLRPCLRLAQANGGRWDEQILIVQEKYDADREADRDAELGKRLIKADWLSILRPMGDKPPECEEVLGLWVDYSQNEPHDGDNLLSCSNLKQPEQPPRTINKTRFHPRRLARYVPRDRYGNPTEFVELAGMARGAPMLGVLKADADSLGKAVSETLIRSDGNGGAALSRLSQALDRFFAEKLQSQMHAASERVGDSNRDRWDRIYTVFAGGDDMLLVGPWDVMLDFAGHLRQLFDQAFGAGARDRPCLSPLTISAGVAIVKPKYPVHLAARQAEELLDQAKAHKALAAEPPKDQCAALGQIWKWKHHGQIISQGKQLADWIDTGVIQRGWLHTLLELALLRCGQAGPECEDVPPQMASSRLAYHAARIWPKPDDPGDRGRAGQWIRQVVDHFDLDPTTADTSIAVRYLPAIARYALLATRYSTQEDRT